MTDDEEKAMRAARVNFPTTDHSVFEAGWIAAKRFYAGPPPGPMPGHEPESLFCKGGAE